MNILLDSKSIAQFVGMGFERTAECVYLSNGAVCYDLNDTNTTVVDTEPPQPPLGNVWKWTGNSWDCIDQSALDAYNAQQVVDFNEGQKQQRFVAYTIESDPIFFKSQRGSATHQEWLDKIAEIDSRFPYKT